MSHSNQTNYEPEVDDYVIWDRGEYGIDEGWVYFKGDPVDNELRIKQGWNPVARYITIETGIRPKPQCQYSKNDPHKYIHTLLLCYDSDWHQLKFVNPGDACVLVLKVDEPLKLDFAVEVLFC